MRGISRVHIFFDRVGYFIEDTEDYSKWVSHENISQDKNRPVYITTFDINCLEDVDVLEDHLRLVIKELRKRFANKSVSSK